MFYLLIRKFLHSHLLVNRLCGTKLIKRTMRFGRFHKRTILFGTALLIVSLLFYLITVEIVTFILASTR